MDLKSGYPYWAIRNGLLCAHPRLERDIACDVAIVGGGITGALIADELSSHGHDVVVVEQRDIGWGSTAASTALLQYEIDTPMIDLCERYGEQAGVLAYRSCAEAIVKLRTLARSVGNAGFAMQQSLYYASRHRDAGTLRKEFETRLKHGFDVDWLDADALHGRFGVDAPCAILTRLAARVDPYRLTYRLLARVARRGSHVFDRTCVAAIEPASMSVRLRTSDGMQIRARHAVMAAGYANESWLRKPVARNRSSYAFVSDPLDPWVLGALRNTLVWETSRPYLYLRSTDDERLLVGGEDDAIDVPARRDQRVEKKACTLMKKVRRAFPRLELRPAFAWAGTFAETVDGLPYFGAHPQHGPRVLFAMAYGGNGITYSVLGAEMLRALIERHRHPLAELFSFARTR